MTKSNNLFLLRFDEDHEKCNHLTMLVDDILTDRVVTAGPDESTECIVPPADEFLVSL